MDGGNSEGEFEEVPLNISSDTSDDQIDQLEPIEDSNPQAIEHSSLQVVEDPSPSVSPPQAIEDPSPSVSAPQKIEHFSLQAVEDPSPSVSPPQAIEDPSPSVSAPQAIEHFSLQAVEDPSPSVSPPQAIEDPSPQASPPQVSPPQGILPLAIENSNPPVNPYGNKYTIKCVTVASVASLVLGFVIGVMSEALVHIDKDNRITKRQVEYQAVILHGLSLFGAIMGGWISDRIGRRYTIMLAGVFLFFGSILMSFLSNNALLLSGRAVTQVGVSFAPMIATIYIAEISPAFSRGCLTSIPQVSINFGTALGYAFNYFTSKFHPNFGRIAMLIMGAISPFLLIILGICVMLESPRWLVMQGHQIEARHILKKFSNSEEEAANQLTSIAEAISMPVEHGNNVQVNMQSSVWRDLLLHPIPIVRHMRACAIGIHLLQQGCGIDTLVLYSPRIFEKAGITSYNTKLILTLSIHVLKALPILIPTFCLDKVGRKRLLLISIHGMIFGLVLLGISLTVLDNSDKKPGWAVGMCIVSLLICVGFYSVGMGPVSLVYSSEIFPLRLRALGNTISVGLNQIMSGVMAIIVLYLYEGITLGGVAFLFMAITLLAHCFVHRIMPETRRQTLEEMQQIFGILNLWRFRVEDATAQGEA